MTSQENLFVLLLGPSGAGKTSIIKSLREMDPSITFVSPVVDRPLREGEKDKTSVDKQTFDDLIAQHVFLVVNSFYGNRYGTPRTTIESILNDGRVPILDWPIQKVANLNDYQKILYNIYVTPPSLGELKNRLDKDRRGEGNDRYEQARKELFELAGNKFRHPHIHDVIINRDHESASRIAFELINKRRMSNK